MREIIRARRWHGHRYERRMLAPSSSLSSSTPLSILSIAGRAGHAFTPPAMMQGFACHARGVELVSCGAARVHARVRSKRVHDVLLRVEQGRLSIACTCPARTYGLDFCKHSWAALLEVDRRDGLSDLRRTRGPLAVHAAPPAPEAPDPEKPAEEKTAPVPDETPPAPAGRRRTEAASTPAREPPRKTPRTKAASAPAPPAGAERAAARQKSAPAKTPPKDASGRVSKTSAPKAKRR